MRYINRVCIALSVLFNVIVGGHSNQTFSARNYHWKKQGKPNLVWMIDHIFFWEPEHSLMSWLYWRTRKDVVHNYEIGEFYDGENDRLTDGESFEDTRSLGKGTTVDRYRRSFGESISE